MSLNNIPIREHLQKLVTAYNQITTDNQDFSLTDFFQNALRQDFGAEIDWLAQFSLISLVISGLRPATLKENFVSWFASPELQSLFERQKPGWRDRFRFWRIKRAMKYLINLSQSDESLEDQDNEAFELLGEQKARFLASYVLSGYTYAEAYSTSLLNHALEFETVTNYDWKTIKSIKQIFPKPPSKTDPEFSQFQKLVNHNKRNALEKLDLIVRGLRLDQQIVKIEKSLNIPSVRGYFAHFFEYKKRISP